MEANTNTNHVNNEVSDLTKHWESLLSEYYNDPLAYILTRVFKIFHETINTKPLSDNNTKYLEEIERLISFGYGKVASNILVEQFLPFCKELHEASLQSNSDYAMALLTMKLRVASLVSDEESVDILEKYFQNLSFASQKEVDLAVSVLIDAVLEHKGNLDGNMMSIRPITDKIRFVKHPDCPTLNDLLVKNIYTHIESIKNINLLSQFDDYVYDVIRVTGMLYTYYWKDGKPFEPFLGSFSGLLSRSIKTRNVRIIRRVCYILKEFQINVLKMNMSTTLDSIFDELDMISREMKVSDMVEDIFSANNKAESEESLSDSEDTTNKFLSLLETGMSKPHLIPDFEDQFVILFEMDSLDHQNRYDLLSEFITTILDDEILAYTGGSTLARIYCRMSYIDDFVMSFFSILREKVCDLNERIESTPKNSICADLKIYINFFLELYNKIKVGKKRVHPFVNLLVYLLESLVRLGGEKEVELVTNICNGHCTTLMHGDRIGRLRDTLMGINGNLFEAVGDEQPREESSEDDDAIDFQRVTVLQFMDFDFLQN